MKKLLLLILLPGLSGCAWQAGRTDAVATQPLPSNYLETEAVGATVSDQSWWLMFADPTLDALMQQLFADNLQLEQGFARLEQARAGFNATRAGQWPSLSLSGSGGRSSQQLVGGEFTGNSYSLTAAASFELDLWGKLAARSRAAGLDLAASRLDLQTLYLSLSAQLADLYYLAVEQRAQLALSDHNLETLADTLKRVESRYRQGLVPSVDVYQARQGLEAARAVRPLYENQLATTEHAISVMLGAAPGPAPAGALAQLPALEQAFPVGLPAQLLTRRPDLQAALNRVAAADARAAAALAARLPSVNLLGSLGLVNQETSIGTVNGPVWSLLGQLAAPLIDGGRLRAEVARSKGQLHEALAGYRQALLVALREVEDALVANRTGFARVQGLEATVAASQATLKLTTRRYLSGLTDYLPVLTSQRTLLQSESSLLAARRQLVAARIALARSLGGNWMNTELERRLTAANGEQK